MYYFVYYSYIQIMSNIGHSVLGLRYWSTGGKISKTNLTSHLNEGNVGRHVCAIWTRNLK